MNDFLPISLREAEKRGWRGFDVIVVTGDAYVDHPSYGAAVIGRVLEAAGFRVGVIAQPDFRSAKDFRRLGRPGLFFAVTGGNIDSMIANYTANKKIRSDDGYSPGGRAGSRPDRAVIIYANRAKEAFAGIPVVIGGIEASCRRLAHYDYWSEKVRRSILIDSKADILVYGMGETQILEIASRVKDGKESFKDLDDIRGTVIARGDTGRFDGAVTIPSYEEVSGDAGKFNEAFTAVWDNQDPAKGRTLIQRHAQRYVIQLPPAAPLSEKELDRIYALPYARTAHPVYEKSGGVPGFETVKNSVISHRGCPGQCSFCSLYLHQGRIVQSRSPGSITDEIKKIAAMPYFKGTITDIGGPTANMYKAECRLWRSSGACADKKCLFPEKCGNLKPGYDRMISLWDEALKVPGVKHVFTGSGVRFDLLNYPESRGYLERLCAKHISGRLKVAPEHTEDGVLKIMNKPGFSSYLEFAGKFDRANARAGKKQHLVHYFIMAHPGCRLEDTLNMSLELMRLGVYPQQVQDFIPLPMTASAAMYHTGKDPFSGRAVYVTRSLRERRMHRALVQYRNPANRRYIIEALRAIKSLGLAGNFFGKTKGGGYGDKGGKTEW